MFIFKKMIKYVFVCFIVSASGSVAFADSAYFPFQPGEKLEYNLSWSGLNAGKASLEVLPIENLNGKAALHFVMKVRSNSFIDKFYKVRDKINSFSDTGMNFSLLYKKKQREGSYRKDITVGFDQDSKTAHYASNNKKRVPLEIAEGTFDPLSAFYYTRCMIKDDAGIIKRPVSDGKKNVTGIVRVVRREKVEVNGRKYDSYLIEPDLKHVGGVFKKSKNAKLKIWISADESRIPLKIKSKVLIGNFVAELSKARGLVATERTKETITKRD